MVMLKEIILWILIQLRIYPNILFTLNPFKMYEFKELKKGVNFSKDDRILDLGCGSGLHSLLLGKKCKEITGIEVSEEAIAEANRKSKKLKIRIKFIRSRIEEAQFDGESFDKIFSICVIEHISNYTEVLKEVYRILKKQGQIIFSVDCLETIEDAKLLKKHKKDHYVEKYFGHLELITLLRAIGYSKIDVYPIFRSPFAKKLFIQGIKDKFRYGFINSIINYLRLVYNEAKFRNENKGLFLIAKCYK